MEAHATTYSPLLRKPRGSILPLIQHLFVEYCVKRQNYKVKKKKKERRAILHCTELFLVEEFEDTKVVIRIHKSKEDQQHNGQKIPKW